MPGAEHEDGGATAQAPVLTSDGEEDGQAALPSPLRASLFAVVERELVRTARRWQTFALRVVFAAVLLGFVALYWSEEVSRMRELDRQSLAQAGRVIFMIYVWTQWMALAALTPILVAQSVIEEREGGTLELLAITRLRPGRILWGKLLSRIVVLELLVLATLPVLAICMSLGGVELGQLANVWLQSSTLIVAGGAVAAFLALWSSGTFSPAIATWGWMFGAWVVGPLPHAAVVRTDEAWAWLSPVYALIWGSGLGTVGPFLTFLPVTVGVVALAAAGFRAMVGNADDALGGLGSLSTDFDGLRRFKKGLAILLVLLLASTPLMLVQDMLSARFPPIQGLSWLWNIGWLCVGTGIYLLVVRWFYILRARKKSRRHRKSWKTLVREWTPVASTGAAAKSTSPAEEEASAWAEATPAPAALGAVVAEATGRSLSGSAPKAVEARRAARFAAVREVWPNPVLWRETVTRAHGGLNRSIWIVYLLLGAMVAFLFFVGGFGRHPAPALASSVASFFMASAVVLMSSTASVASELRSKTLELLCSTRMSSLQILGGKLASTALLASPAFVIGSGTLLLGIGAIAELDSVNYQAMAPKMSLLLRWLGLTMWMGASLFAVACTCHWIGLRARSASRVWIWTIAWAIAMALGPVFALALGEGSRLVELAVAAVNPLLSDQLYEERSLPIELFVAVASWALAGLCVFVVNVLQLRKRAMRQ